MKKLLLMTVGVTVLGMAPALAADLPVRTYTKAPVPAPVLTWGGFYLGVEGGGGFGKDELRINGKALANTDISGALGGGVIGYNWQLPNNLVFGIEGKLDAADISGTSACLNVDKPADCHSKLDSLFSATGRVGYAFGPTLLYVKGGGAWANDKTSITAAAGAASGSATRSGWTIGAGLEYMIVPSWSAKIEYDYYDFGNKTVTLVDQGGVANDLHSNLTVNTIKAGVNYHFGDSFSPKF
jgi:outer membrane immunogenic protein